MLQVELAVNKCIDEAPYIWNNIDETCALWSSYPAASICSLCLSITIKRICNLCLHSAVTMKLRSITAVWCSRILCAACHMPCWRFASHDLLLRMTPIGSSNLKWGYCVFTPVLNSNCDFTPIFFDFAFLPLLFANEHSFYPYSVNSS